ncbi:Swt1 family HEPN domain-containing protein, partial [Pectobacterium versatile]|uniref:Swt1 family HEPN domain-containing protein n=1 Tax=Pectobacterium versatile TaxID=2488639 RepID=UPI001F299E8A|nr:Swt1 family HEPN domain-containing protein [Pectobacterium versatile]
MDIGQALKNTENSLRDFISLVMEKKYGDDWISNVINEDKIKKWNERKNEDLNRLGSSDERIIYYADFYDISNIIKKHWDNIDDFPNALGKKKEIEFLLDKLESYRNPHAHSRELLPHQKNLLLGIEGEIRTRLINYRNKLDDEDNYYPRIEHAQDNLGTNHIPKPRNNGQTINTGKILRPKDKIDFVVTARDPKDLELFYAIRIKNSLKIDWVKNNTFSIEIKKEDIGERFIVDLMIKNTNDYRRFQEYDHDVRFEYKVLPPL